MKALIATSVASMVDQFLKPSIKILQELGYEVVVACNFDDCGTITQERCAALKQYLSEQNVDYKQVDFPRNPLKINQIIRSYKQTMSILKADDFSLCHCHSPIGGLVTRLACKRFRKDGLKVIYTAHGFHFYKGAPLKNWLLFYPIEKMCSRWTDVLITINKEDYERAKKKFKAGKVEYIPGVGIDTKKFSPEIISDDEKTALKAELGIKEKEKVFLSVGELSKRKNHEVVLEALSKWEYTDYKYYIVGKGELKTYLEEKIKEYGLVGKVELLGYRNDISALCSIADLFIFPSLQEGLPVALMEAIASKATVICSRIRGSEELVTEDNLFSATNSDEVKDQLNAYMAGDLEETVASNYRTLKQFDLEKVNQDMKKLYGGVLNSTNIC